jgi:hypothetical protein
MVPWKARQVLLDKEAGHITTWLSSMVRFLFSSCLRLWCLAVKLAKFFWLEDAWSVLRVASWMACNDLASSSMKHTGAS